MNGQFCTLTNARKKTCAYQREKHPLSVTPAHRHTNKMTNTISLPWRLAQKTEEWKSTLFSWSNIESVRHSLWLKTQHPRCRKKKKNQHNGKTHRKPICSASTKNNLCQVHQRVGLKRSSHFIIEVGSSRVGLPVNVVPRSAFRTFILVILQKKKWTEEMSSPYII